MLNDFDENTANKLTNWATYIVVGAGAAGCVVATRLAEDPKNNVLLVELGPNNSDSPWIQTPGKSSYLYDDLDGPRPSPSSLSFETNCQLGRKYTYPRGDGLGGSTNHHALVDGRGSPQIYDKISELVGDERWSYNNVLPYFKKMESYNSSSDSLYHGHNGWLQIRRGTVKAPLYKDFIIAANEITGAPIQDDMSGNPRNASGLGITDVQITPDGKRSAAFNSLLMPYMSRNNNIVVLLNTLVTKVVIQNMLAIGIQTLHKPNAYLADKSSNRSRDKSFRASFHANKEVILCGGAINTPQLLMLSGIGPSEHLISMNIPVVLDRPGVGSQLMDHHEMAVVYEVDPRKMVWPGQASSIIDKINSFEYKNDGLLALKSYMEQFADKQEESQGSGEIVLDWYSGLDTDIGHDLHITSGEGFWFDFDLSSTEPLPDGKLRIDYLRSQYDLFHPNFLRSFYHCLIEVLKPGRADGTIRLASSDPTISPILDLGLYKDDEAAERMACGIQMVREINKHPRMKQYYKLDTDGDPIEIFPGKHLQTIDQLKYYLKRWSAFGHHISGTAKMGRQNNAHAVLDSRLRVFGIPNLRVIDTSVYPFPYLHGYNTSRGAYLVGELGADFIKEDASV